MNPPKLRADDHTWLEPYIIAPLSFVLTPQDFYVVCVDSYWAVLDGTHILFWKTYSRPRHHSQKGMIQSFLRGETFFHPIPHGRIIETLLPLSFVPPQPHEY